jgi:molybdate transport system substrate-binding protein
MGLSVRRIDMQMRDERRGRTRRRQASDEAVRTPVMRVPSLCVFATVVAFCSGTGTAGELVIAAAASLREPIETLVAEYDEANPGGRTRITFGASSALAAQIRLGAPVDVFLSADPRLIDALATRGLISADTRFPFASNRLVVVKRPGSALRIDRAGDLVQPAIRRVAMPAEAVPLGRYARSWLTGQGLLDALMPRIVATEHARATLAAVENEHADVAIVYATDARVARSARIAFEIPTNEQPEIVYSAAAMARGPEPIRSRAFLAALRKPRAASLLSAAGFIPWQPSPHAWHPGPTGTADK